MMLKDFAIPTLRDPSSLDISHHNVTSVAPSRTPSPFRYPGGKSWLFPLVRDWLAAIRPRPKFFFEPFAGGANFGLLALNAGICEHLFLNELDKKIAAVWTTILNDSDWLVRKIRSFNATEKNLATYLAQSPTTLREQAFQSLLKNRVSRAGIVAPGAGLLKRGENDQGVFSRWYPETLARRIEQIALAKRKITFSCNDALHVIENNYEKRNTFWFIDPPYTIRKRHAGTRLYDCAEIDHGRLFQLLQARDRPFLITYNESEFCKRLAREFAFSSIAAKMITAHHKSKRELIITGPRYSLDMQQLRRKKNER
jgi:DNA adenine methylase